MIKITKIQIITENEKHCCQEMINLFLVDGKSHHN